MANNFCAKCGNPIEANQNFCANCGAQVGTFQSNLGEQTQTDQSQVNQNNGQSQSNFDEPNNFVQQQFNQGYQNQYDNLYSQATSDPDFMNFIGKNQYYYAEQFTKIKLTNSKVTWNWPAFLFNVLWFAYRKMYGYAAAVFGAIVLLSLTGIGSFLSFGVSLAAGIFGNSIYMKKYEEEMAISKTMSPEMKKMYLYKKGGTNIGAVIGIIVIQVIFFIILFTVLFAAIFTGSFNQEIIY
ncbi:MAG: hypothetical protein K0R71_1882 [Bacillales bacterium]|nr:hypothetical protein [Bacillales bacterium]